MFGRSKIVKVTQILPSGQPLFDLPDIKTLSKEVKKIYESPHAFYGVTDSEVILRVKKKTFTPKIREVKSVAIGFSQNSIYLSKGELLNLASDYGFEVLATPQFYVLLSHGLTFLARREGLSHGRR